MDETKVRYNVNQTQPEHNVHVLRFHFASTSISFLCLHVMDFKGARIFVHSLEPVKVFSTKYTKPFLSLYNLRYLFQTAKHIYLFFSV